MPTLGMTNGRVRSRPEEPGGRNTIRGRILSAFEQAELCNDPEVRKPFKPL